MNHDVRVYLRHKVLDKQTEFTGCLFAQEIMSLACPFMSLVCRLILVDRVP